MKKGGVVFKMFKHLIGYTKKYPESSFPLLLAHPSITAMSSIHYSYDLIKYGG